MTLGGHWLALQSLAWARMVRDFSRHESLVSALAKTFDGKHPCKLCLAIQHGQNSEKKAAQPELTQKIDGFLPVNHVALRGVAEYPPVVLPPRAFSEWSEPPPTPPPRSA
jgi:hypothetical protein